MSKQTTTPEQERKLRFMEAGILFTVILGLAVFVGLRLVGGGEDTPAPVAVLATDPVVESGIAVGAGTGTPAVIDSTAFVATAEPAVAPEPEPIAEPQIITYAMAEQAYLDRDYARAVDLFDRYTDQHKTNAWGFYMLGLSNWKAGDLEQADEAFTYAIDLAPTHVKSMVNHGRVLLELGRTAEAADRVAMALELEPDNGDANRVMGRILAAQGRGDEAAAVYAASLAANPDDAWALNNLGLILIGQERFEDALAPLAKASLLLPGSAVIENNLGVALERTGHYGAAGEAFARALAADPAYGKAEISRLRVAALSESAEAGPVDLAALAAAYGAAPQTETAVVAVVEETVVEEPVDDE